MSDVRWYVAQTHAHAELKAEKHLRRKGFSTYGVSRMIGGEKGPIAVREGIVGALRQNEGADGYFRANRPSLVRGAAVRMLDGVFASRLGLFQDMRDKDRVAVLLDLLGRRVRVVLEAESVAAA